MREFVIFFDHVKGYGNAAIIREKPVDYDRWEDEKVAFIPSAKLKGTLYQWRGRIIHGLREIGMVNDGEYVQLTFDSVEVGRVHRKKEFVERDMINLMAELDDSDKLPRTR